MGCWCSGILNLTRKTKIRITVACSVLGVATAIILKREFSGEVNVFYAGVAPQGPQLPSFIITNSFRKPVVYYLEEDILANASWREPIFHYTNYTGRILGRSAETIIVKADTVQPWRFFVVYNDSWITSFVVNTRARLARFASGQNWTRLSKWLQPPSSFRRVSSPAMLGNKPAEAAQP